MRSKSLLIVSLVVAGCFYGPEVMAGCSGGGSGASLVPLPAVAWSKDAKEAISTGTTQNKPVLLYFCSTDAAKVVGTGSTGWTSFRQANPKVRLPKPSAFESQAILTSFKKAGLDTFAKVPALKENKALFAKYGAGLNTLVAVAPGGKKLKVYFGKALTQATLIKSMQSFKQDFAKWEKSQPKQKVAQVKSGKDGS